MAESQTLTTQIKKVEQSGLIYSINEEEKTASVIGSKSTNCQIIIPHYIIHETNKYIITNISKDAFKYPCQIRSVNFSSDSEIRTIEENAFSSSLIESLSIPSSLSELKDGWCHATSMLTNIQIDAKNPYYKIYDDKYIIGKSSEKNENFDVLIFSIRNLTKATIPNFIEIIGPFAFQGCNRLKEIEIPKDSKLRIIEKYAFSHSIIEKISIPSNLTKICENSFYICEEFKSIEIPDDSKLRTIEKEAFYGSLIESIKIPSSLIELKEGWCTETPYLTSISINKNNQIYSIYDNKYIIGKSSPEKENFDVLVFAIRSITKAIIPNFIEKISSFAFEKCKNLQQIEILKNSKLRIIEKNAFNESSIQYISIPSQVTQICEGAFSNCFNLKIVEFQPDSKLQIIEKNLFNRSSLYLNFSIPSQVTEIKEGAFSSCSSLKHINIPKDSKLQIIEKYAFFGSSIEKVFIPKKVTKIGKHAFSLCKKLKKVEFQPNSELQVIEDEAFLMTSITNISFPSSVTQIGRCSFACKKLKKIEFPFDSKLRTIDESAFTNTLIESIKIPSGLVELKNGWCKGILLLNKIEVDEKNPFYSVYDNKFIIGKSSPEKENFDVLVFSVRDIKTATIPDFIEIIDSFAFQGCDQLQKVEFQNDSKLRIIEKYAFFGLSIESISIPPHVTRICERGFYLCSQLSNIEFQKNSEIQIIENEAFYFNSIESINIPSSLIDLKDEWCNEMSMLTKISVDENNPIYSNFDDKFIIGKSSPEKENFDVLVISVRDIEKATIPDFIEKVGSYSFQHCNQLKEIKISKDSQLKIIEKYAFSYSIIKDIKIPKFVKRICKYAFNHCKELGQIEFSNNSELESIEDYAFCDTPITGFCIPPHITQINEYTFSGCKKLMIIEIVDDSEIDFIDKNAFKDQHEIVIMISVKLINSFKIRY